MKKPSMEQIPVDVFFALLREQVADAINRTGGDPVTMEVMGRSGALSHTVVVAARRWVQDTAFTHEARTR